VERMKKGRAAAGSAFFRYAVRMLKGGEEEFSPRNKDGYKRKRTLSLGEATVFILDSAVRHRDHRDHGAQTQSH
jgi:hypothetical protein